MSVGTVVPAKPEPATPADPAPPEKIALLYDFSKHLLSLALLGLGGIVSLSQSPQGQRIPRLIVSMMLGCLALSGVFSLSCTAGILRARQRGLPVANSAWTCSQCAMLFLGVGVGGFVVIWIEAGR